MVVDGAKMAVTGVTPVTPVSTFSVKMVNPFSNDGQRFRLKLSPSKNFVVRAVLCIFAENYEKNEERDYCTSTVDADQGAVVCQRYAQHGTDDEHGGAG